MMTDRELINAMSEMLDQRLQALSHSMDQKLQTLSDSMDQQFSVVNQRLDSLEQHLELETDKNIRIIAEGHLDLQRKLNETLYATRKIESTHEMTQLRLTVLESDVREIKTKLAQIA